jgi:aldose 1-epimerase
MTVTGSQPGSHPPIVLTAPGATAVVDVDAGGRLASLLIGGSERIVARPSAGDRGIRWGSFLMAPWAGRIGGAGVDWDGSSYRLEANDGPHAIHGVVFDRPWRVRAAASAVARLEIDLGPLAWPFGGLVRQAVRLSADEIELTAEITAADLPMPAALGWHPWFRRPTDGDMAVRVEAADTLETAADLIPTGRRVPVGGATDLRTGPPLGERRLDHVYADVGSPVVVSWPDLTLTMTSSPAVRTFVVHSPPTGVCVEPQTAWPDAIALDARGVRGTGLTSLAVGETFRATTTWRWSAPG